MEDARNEIIRACVNKDVQKVEYLSLDIGEDYDAVAKALSDLERTMGPIYMLVNCAGTAICGKVEDTSVADLKKMININFLGSYYCTKAIVQRMKASQEGIIVFTSSQAALLGTCTDAPVKTVFNVRFTTGISVFQVYSVTQLTAVQSLHFVAWRKVCQWNLHRTTFL